ncbi:MAG: tRNA dihydrouridine(20/20a) synthase DusA [Alphaproteobacteria bacterium]
MGTLDRRLAVAPMMERTDRHCRFFLRLITPHALLYSEMITSAAILHGDRARLLDFDAHEHPLALQLGGSDPQDLAVCAKIAEDWGYDEVNLNVGCPSDRVRSGRFGASLMAEPGLVADCVEAMARASTLPVTVKCRTGIDARDGYENLLNFVDTVAGAGCVTFIVHARVAVLGGLSPKQNREIPPLQYDLVHRLKKDRPNLEIILNGGLQLLDDVRDALARTDGAMIGREAYQNPYFLAALEAALFNQTAVSRHAVIDAYRAYAAQALAGGTPLHQLSRHALGLFQGLPGARAFRRHISQNAHLDGAGVEVITDAAALVPAPN